MRIAMFDVLSLLLLLTPCNIVIQNTITYISNALRFAPVLGLISLIHDAHFPSVGGNGPLIGINTSSSTSSSSASDSCSIYSIQVLVCKCQYVR
jgi:hypothetical protein